MKPETRAWFEITRASNLPTALSGVVVMVSFGYGRLWQITNQTAPDWNWPLIALLVAVSCFYLAGFILNDVLDHEVDLRERPGRPIPSGRVDRRVATQVAIAMIVVGLLLVARVDGYLVQPDGPRAPTGIIAAACLVLFIVMYDGLHLASSWTVFLMGACRSMVYVMCLLAGMRSLDSISGGWWYGSIYGVVQGPVIPFVVLIGLYVAGFSRIARGEVASPEGGTCCYRCGFPARADSDRCSECGLGLDPERLARSTSPPMSRTLESLCVTATFLPSCLLLGLSGYLMLEALWQGREMSSTEFWTYLAPALSRLAASFLVALLTIGWLAVAARRYRADRTRPTRSILMWLAAIPLMDGNLSLHLNMPWWVSLTCLGLFFVTVWGHRRITGT